MRRTLLILILYTTLGINMNAQTVSYTYKPLAAEGCTMKYSVAKKDSTYLIVVTVSSDRMRFLSEPTMKIRTFGDEVITLEGIPLHDETQSIGVMAGNVMIPISSISSTAQFKVTPEQFEEIRKGISKVLVFMSPMNHERTFKKDKIGKKLYQLFLKVKAQDDNF